MQHRYMHAVRRSSLGWRRASHEQHLTYLSEQSSARRGPAIRRALRSDRPHTYIRARIFTSVVVLGRVESAAPFYVHGKPLSRMHATHTTYIHVHPKFTHTPRSARTHRSQDRRQLCRRHLSVAVCIQSAEFLHLSRQLGFDLLPNLRARTSGHCYYRIDETRVRVGMGSRAPYK